MTWKLQLVNLGIAILILSVCFGNNYKLKLVYLFIYFMYYLHVLYNFLFQFYFK